MDLICSSKIYEIQYISDKGPISLDNFNLCLQHWQSRMEYRCDKGIFVRKPQGFQDPQLAIRRWITCLMLTVSFSAMVHVSLAYLPVPWLIKTQNSKSAHSFVSVLKLPCHLAVIQNFPSASRQDTEFEFRMITRSIKINCQCIMEGN